MTHPEKDMHRAGFAAQVSGLLALVSFVAFVIGLAILFGGR